MNFKQSLHIIIDNIKWTAKVRQHEQDQKQQQEPKLIYSRPCSAKALVQGQYIYAIKCLFFRNCLLSLMNFSHLNR